MTFSGVRATRPRERLRRDRSRRGLVPLHPGRRGQGRRLRRPPQPHRPSITATSSSASDFRSGLRHHRAGLARRIPHQHHRRRGLPRASASSPAPPPRAASPPTAAASSVAHRRWRRGEWAKWASGRVRRGGEYEEARGGRWQLSPAPRPFMPLPSALYPPAQNLSLPFSLCASRVSCSILLSFFSVRALRLCGQRPLPRPPGQPDACTIGRGCGATRALSLASRECARIDPRQRR